MDLLYPELELIGIIKPGLHLSFYQELIISIEKVTE
jgi:hypothetical protein